MSRPKVMAGIASIPERERALERTIASIAPQVDEVFLSLNGYGHWPAFLDAHRNVRAVVRPENGGDAEKFADVNEWDGVVVTCDDDLLYPSDYVATLLAGLDRHGHDKIVGFHGGTTAGWNGRHSAANEKIIRCLGELEVDDPDVNVLGTGVLAFDAAEVPIWREIFRTPNMADVYLAAHARRFGIRMVALAHEAGWLKDICPARSPKIYQSNKDGDGSARDTRGQRRAVLDSIDWTSAGPGRPRVHVAVATCDRPELLGELLLDLDQAAQRLDVEVSVYQDPTRADYTLAKKFVESRGWTWHTFRARLGKRHHWQLVNQELADCRESDAEWFVFLPDDVRLVRHALARAIDTWARLDDPATLTLWRLKDQEGQPNWTGLIPVDRGDAWEVFHVDGIYLAQRPTLEALGYRCPGFPLRAGKVFTSSGVGRNMSLHLHSLGARMYRVARSLAIPVRDIPSVMNPDVKDRRYPWVTL